MKKRFFKKALLDLCTIHTYMFRCVFIVVCILLASNDFDFNVRAYNSSFRFCEMAGSDYLEIEFALYNNY